MRQKKLTGLLFVASITIMLCSCGKDGAAAMNQNISSQPATEEADLNLGIAGVYGELYETENGSGLSYTEGISEEEMVRLTANVTPDMMMPEYWMGSNAGGIIMTREQICELNRKMMEQFAPAQIMFDLPHLKENISRGYIKQLIENFSMPAKNYYYVDGENLTQEFQNEISSQRNINGIPANPQIRYGIATDRTSIRAFPSDALVTDNAKNLYYDLFQNSELLVSEPVAILHTSLDNNWFFVFSDRAFGWVSADTIALCRDKEQWLDWQKDDNIMVVTGKRVVLDKNPYDPSTAETVLTMGSVLQIATEEELKEVDYDRIPYGCITVKLPVREEDGYLGTTYAYVPMGEDISVGYMDYTEENLLKQSFKMIGTAYGWGGIHDVTDCSGYIYQVYRCFGFRFPRNSGQQASIPATRYNITKKSTAEKKEVLDKLPTGSLLRFPGHMMMYLGQRNGKYYVISALSNFVPEDAESNDAVHPRSIMINTLDVRRLDGSTWLDNLTTVCVIE